MPTNTPPNRQRKKRDEIIVPRIVVKFVRVKVDKVSSLEEVERDELRGREESRGEERGEARSC